MTRLANVVKAGYFPLPDDITPLIRSFIAAPHGGRILDPCAGEGAALRDIAQYLGLEPYGVELHTERAQKAEELVQELLSARGQTERTSRHVLHDSYQVLKSTPQAFNLLYENPPYLFADDGSLDGRTEYQWLRDTRQWLQAGGLLVWVVPQHLLKHSKTAHYLSAWFQQVRVYRFPDPWYEQFKQIIVFGLRRKRSAMPSPNQVKEFRAIAELGPQLPVIQKQEQPIYTLPPPIVDVQSFLFRGLFVDPDEAFKEALALGVTTSREFQEHVKPRQSASTLNPLTPMKIGHLAGIIAAGHMNNQLLAKGDETFLIKGHSYKSKSVSTQDEAREGGGYTRRTLRTDTVITTITTLNADGTIEDRSGPQLEAFMSEWTNELVAAVAQQYKPQYEFDLNGFGPAINKLNLKRLIPMVGKPGLLPAQKHAAAAAATRLQKKPDAIIAGVMGTGKTLMGPAAVAAIHKHVEPQSHIIVLCPPHLVNKWEREIKIVWPAAKATILEKCRDVDRFFAEEGPIFGILKETTARAGGGWSHTYNFCGPVVAERRGPKEKVKLTRQPVLLHSDGWIKAHKGKAVKSDKLLAWRHYSSIRCPKCGSLHIIKDVKATPQDFKRGKEFCHHCKAALWQDEPLNANLQPGAGFKVYAAREAAAREGKLLVSMETGTNRYPLATYIKRRYKKRLDLLIADEVHQYKGMDSDRGYAFHRLATAARRVIGLTGTLYGGKASSLFDLLYRISPEVRREFTDTSRTGQRRLLRKEWVEKYGILQEVESQSFDEDGKLTGNAKVNVTIKELPGASPAMLPWLLNNSVFVSLEDMGLALPPYEEIPIAVEMSAAMKQTYRSLKAQLDEELRQRLIRDDKSLLGAYLQALLTWPDSPWRNKVIRDPRNEEKVVAAVKALPAGQLYPKEQAIIDLIKQEKAEGRRCLLLCQQTATLDITPQWVEMLRHNGLKSAVLRVDPNKREAWIKKQVEAGVDVIITHPRRVETGLDLLEFPTIIWMGTEYSVYTIQQASRRSWRIGQEKPVKVYYYVYEDTLQEEAIHLIAAKVAAAMRVTGDTIEDDSLADMNDLSSQDIVSALTTIIKADLEKEEAIAEIKAAWVEAKKGNLTHSERFSFAGCANDEEILARYRELMEPYRQKKVESLQDAFRQANEEIRQSNSHIGGYEMEQGIEPTPGNLTVKGRIQLQKCAGYQWVGHVVELIVDDWGSEYIRWFDGTRQPIFHMLDGFSWESVPDDTPLTEPPKVNPDKFAMPEIVTRPVDSVADANNGEKPADLNGAAEHNGKTRVVQKRIVFGEFQNITQGRKKKRQSSTQQLSLF